MLTLPQKKAAALSALVVACLMTASYFFPAYAAAFTALAGAIRSPLADLLSE